MYFCIICDCYMRIGLLNALLSSYNLCVIKKGN